MAFEALAGIRERITVRRVQRRRQHSSVFSQLRQFIVHKAARAAILVAWVDPRNTSRTCPRCGLIDKRNRPTQAAVRCVGCGFAGLADTIAAGNIARRAAVTRPHLGSAPQQAPASSVLTLGQGR
jgi:transposase